MTNIRDTHSRSLCRFLAYALRFLKSKEISQVRFTSYCSNVLCIWRIYVFMAGYI